MPGPHRKMVTQEESATVIEGEGEGVAREAGRAEGRGLRDGGVRGTSPEKLIFAKIQENQYTALKIFGVCTE